MTDSPSPALSGSQGGDSLFVVGVGASAGGIKALQEFFAHVTADSGLAYAVILHLSPEHESRLAEVIQSASAIPVAQVTSATRVKPDHVYVIPPNKVMRIEDSTLTVSDIATSEQRRAPVDVFFRALGDTHGAQAVGVVLSGTGPDGCAGLKRVKEYGGLVIAQDPSEAEYPDMPRNAIATGLVDLVLPAAQMPPRITQYVEHLQRESSQPGGAGVGDAEAVRDVLTLLRVRTGHDFSNYKPATVQRRINRRMTVRGVSSVDEYVRLLRYAPEEPPLLMKDLLISVTNFFRDPAAWDALAQRIIPRLFIGRGPTDQVRVWSAGCATGEEAYSLAMLLGEYAAAAVEPPSIQLFATDLDERAIGVAREGFYTAADVVDVSADRLQRFFQRDAQGYRVRRELRELVLFAHHNVLKDPPFSHLDLIACRNLLIYLNRPVQERVVETFHFALRPARFLFLGASESPEAANDLFLRVDAVAHVYESRTVTSRVALPLADVAVPQIRGGRKPPDARAADRMWPPELHHRLLEQYAPPSVVINNDHNIVHMSAQAGRYMEVRGGEPTRDLLAVVRPELRPDLRTALHQAIQERSTVEVRDVEVAFDGRPRRVHLTIRPVLHESDPARGYFLVLFEETPSAGATERVSQVTGGSDAVAQHLEQEIARVKAQLRHTVEQYETQVEEAKASNEELQAMNEELRSAAEELETSKEELQSVNEELTTVNQELKIKIEELGLTNNDFHNLINATDIGTIFIDRQLRVKFSTPRARDIFNLLESDSGRPITDITARFKNDHLRTDVELVLERLQTVEREVETADQRWHLMRMLPYRTADNHIDGVVLTFQDITEHRRSDLQVRQSEERLRLLIDSALDYAIFTITDEGTIDSWNAGAERMFGYRAEEIIGEPAEILFTPEDRAAGAAARELDEARRNGRAADERYHMRKNGARFFCSGVTRRLGLRGLGFAKIARDLTSREESAAALESARSELERHVRERTAQLQAEVVQHESAKSAITNLLHRVVSAQEDERGRIARDLHDQFGQQLTALRLALERHQSEHGGRVESIEEALALTRQISKDVDFLAWELRPAVLDELGLVAALPRFLAEWSGHVGLATEFRLRGFETGHLPREAELAYYRIAQEALNNVAKHAHASRVDVILAVADDKVVLVVEDDGIGFDAAGDAARDGGLGIAGMKERAALVGAAVDIESTPGKGTSVFVRCPVAACGR